MATRNMPVATTQTLSTSDLAWLRVQTPENLAVTTTTLVVDGQLDASCVRSRLEDRFMIHQRFRQRIETSQFLLARPRWRECDDFRLADHFIELDLTDPGMSSRLEGIVSDLRSRPLDESRPLWQAHLVHLRQGTSALIVRVHAAVADCTSVPDLTLALTDLSSADHPSERFELETLPSLQQILDRASRTANATRTLCTLITARADRDTPLRGRVGNDKSIGWSEPVPHKAFVARAAELGTRPVELVLAAVAGGLRRTLHRHDFPVQGIEIKAIVPWNLRRSDDAPTGSRLALVRIGLPVGEPSAADRLGAIQREIERLALDPERWVVLGTDSSHTLSMTEIEERSVRLLGQKTTVVLGLFRAPTQMARLCDRPVRAIHWSPIPAGETAVAIGMVDYAGDVGFEVVCDRSLDLDADRLAADLAAATSEI